MANLLRVFNELVIEDTIRTEITDETVLRRIDENSGFHLTDLGIYTVLSQGAKVFRDALNRSDRNYKYTVLSKEKEVKDPEKVKEKKAEFAEAQKEMNKLVEEWKNENPDAFIETRSIPNVAKYCSKELNLFYAEIIMDPDVAYYLFRSFELASKEFTDQNKDKLMTATRKIISPEYASEYKKVQEEIRKELGIPSNDEIKEMVDETIIVQTQSLRRTKVDHDELDMVVKEAALEAAVEYGKLLAKNFKSASLGGNE